MIQTLTRLHRCTGEWIRGRFERCLCDGRSAWSNCRALGAATRTAAAEQQCRCRCKSASGCCRVPDVHGITARRCCWVAHSV